MHESRYLDLRTMTRMDIPMKVVVYTCLRSCLTAVLLLRARAIAEAAPLPGQLIVDANNPSWLRYHGGGPFFLAGPGDPEDFLYRGSINADGTRSGDQASLIRKLRLTGANSIYMQIIRSHGGDGKASHNPFVNHDPSQGLNHNVLDQWETWFEAMDAAGIVIYMFIYDDDALIWHTGDAVEKAERDFVTAIVDRFEHHLHLIWVIAEEYAEQLSAKRASTLATLIRAQDDHDHPIAIHKNSGLDFGEFASNPSIDQFAIQLNVSTASDLHDGINQAWRDADSRYNLNMSESFAWGSGAKARRKAWAVAMGGAYVMAFDMNIADTPIADLEDLGRLRMFMESIPFDRLSPHDELTAGDSDYILAEPDNRYLIYAVGDVSDIGLRVEAAGHYEMRWFDPMHGEEILEKSGFIQPGTIMWPKPESFADEVVLFLERSHLNPLTLSPPENLAVE
jgi:hypothetical protein